MDNEATQRSAKQKATSGFGVSMGEAEVIWLELE